MKKTIAVVAVASFLVLSVQTSAFAFLGRKGGAGKMCPMGQPEYGWQRGGEEARCPVAAKFMKKAHFFTEHAEELGLTEEQTKSIEDLKIAREKAQIQATSETKIFELDLKQKLSEDKLDVEGIQVMIDTHTAAMAKSMKDSVADYAKLKALLSDEQLAKAKTMWHQKKRPGPEEGKA